MRIEPFGDGAWLLRPTLAGGSAVARAEELAAWRAAVARDNPAARELVVGSRALLVVAERAPTTGGARTSVAFSPREHTLEVIYDGPELAEIAARAGLIVDRAIALHSDVVYVATLIGFLPGFAYLSEVDPRLVTPRLATPRPRVAAGSVGIAGARTGVYPRASPGGWALIGRAPHADLFDAARAEPGRIALADRVRFVPIEPSAAPSAPPALQEGGEPAPPRAPAAYLRVESAFGLVTVQDRGRFGRRAYGLPWSGPLDREAHDAANAAVGNDEDAATIEVAGGKLVLIVERGPLHISLDGEPQRELATGDRLVVQPAQRLAAYLALAGGVDVDPVLGSRATLLSAGIGGYRGRSLRRGDVLTKGSEEGTRVARATQFETFALADEVHLDVAKVSLDDRLAPSARDELAFGRFVVSAALDRTGARLDGGRISRAAPDTAESEPTLPGAIQITSDGTPVVLGPDAATTGGYPVIGVLDAASRARFGRLRPGRSVRFRFRA